MLRSLLVASLRYRLAVVVAAAALLAAGAYRATRTPLDVFPEFAPPLVEVQVEAPGLSSEDVEQLVTLPLEAALNGVPRMTVLRSKSVQGLSSVTLIFERGTDVFQARQIVSEAVAVEAARLPQQVKPPRVMPILSSTSRVLKIGLTPKIGPDGLPLCSQIDISVLMKWVIEPRLFAVPGVANVSTYGELDKQYQVLVKPQQLKAHNVTLDQVKTAARQAVAYGSAGFHDTPNQRLAVTYATRITRPEDLAKTVVAYRAPASGTGPATPILLGDVATLTTGIAPPVGDGVVNDQAGLLVVIEKYPWANTLQVTRDVEPVGLNGKPGTTDKEGELSAQLREQGSGRPMHSVWSIRLPALFAGGLLLAGRVTRSSSLAPLPEMPLRPPVAAPVVHAPEVAPGPLTLARLLEMADQHPDVASARARAESARGRLIQAGLYPNPTVTGRIDELGNPKNSVGFPAVTFTQVIVTHSKIPLAQAAAAARVDAADWQALTFWYAVRLRVQQAYYELLTAEREVEATRELQRIAEQALAVAEKLLKGGTGTQLDVLRAQVDHNQSEVRAAVSQRRLEAAGRLLATAVGLPGLPRAPGADGAPAPLIVGNLDGPAPPLEWEELREAMLERSSEVQEARALVFQAERLLKSARAAAKPDVTVSVRPIYSAPDRTAEVLLEVGAPIPIFNRNQGNIYAAEADLARAAADSRAVELRVTDRLTTAY